LLDAGKTKGEIPITVSFGTKSQERQMRVEARAKNLSASAPFSLKIIGDEETGKGTK